MPHFSKLLSMNLSNTPEVFDIKNFYVYMKLNKTFFLLFYNPISKAYKNRVEKIIDEIISTEILNYKPPFIDFDGHEKGKKFQLYNLRIGNTV
uniref:Uncharacterized protein n=1 Tax=Panagrolaimus sp. PS1159 TaxID=55785 RepID=A0AC35GT17_9BILA